MTTSRPSVELIRSPQLTSDVPYAYAGVAQDVRDWSSPPAPARWTRMGAPCRSVMGGGPDRTGDGQHAVALRAAGAGLTDVVKTTVYVATTAQEDLRTAWEIVSRHFGTHDAPSTLLGVAVLGYRDQLVEVEAVAALR